ncbi:3-alpha-hydroxycholanate dehydrogenase (plasmid) [Caballeronia sp. SBC1]|uniref:SDR family NAD(P)-dependent oxidoreductase n=1 Tax=unclassified Caballeronia TaxID=2646786 RepID=UPI0013E13F74|nr:MULTISPECIES: SDR family NAD(P)-dependent oxidoreductase [unclassified Caballeronia]QIE26717.1 3-alpha-hydroxycholanate dehydrogenase [Caballeronia sp. SBC2]QIN63967.1 3-alpha-hydroxycholanate dehydrogenase [Caballeronia sp. SBC1]
MNISFEGKVVAVSGAAIGFGRAIAKRFASMGAMVFACDLRADALAELARDGITTTKVDLTDRAAAAAWIQSVEERAGMAIDVLVNNAGGVAGQAHRPIEKVSDDDWNRLIEINLGASFALSRAAAPAMKRAGKGAIINISSGAALQASLTGVQAYCSAKHAVLGLTRQLAHELGPHGVRVNSVAPGFVRTNEATEKQWAAFGEDKQRSLMEGIALRRLGTPEDIANAVIFLASDLASFVNGQILSVDGGR